jgi:DNA-binding transcriptional MerR regulator
MVEGRFYTLTQAARLIGIKPHILRYWEKEFRWLQPGKNSAGRRIYSEHDIELVRLIDRLVHKEGYSIAGAQKRVSSLLALSNQLQLPLSEVRTNLLEQIKKDLRELREMLEHK